jgi:hypothetical protein
MSSAWCGTRWPRLFSRWRAAGQRKLRPGLIGGVLAIRAGALIWQHFLRVGCGRLPAQWTLPLGAGQSRWGAYLPRADSGDEGFRAGWAG